MTMPANASSQHAKTLIVGLGKTGLSCARHLVGRGEQVAITDSRLEPPGLDELRAEMPDVALFLGGFDRAVFASADRLIVSPGVSVAIPEIRAARALGVEVIGDIELFAREVQAPVAAITGSNGKSTVTTLLAEMTRAAGVQVLAGGNLGEPALDLLARPAQLYLLELSSFQLETTDSLRPAAAAVLNVSPDHMDRYPSLEAYAAAKARILDGARHAVLNADDPLVMAMAERCAGEIWTFSIHAPSGERAFGLRTIDGETWLCRDRQTLLPARDLRIPGRHNQANVLASLAMGSALDLELEPMLATARAFRGLPHRTQFVAEHRSVGWYNDSKGTNLGACLAAIQGLCEDRGQKVVLIAGGDCKGADFGELGPVLAGCARAIVLMGRDADRIAAVVPEGVSMVRVGDMDEAVARAAELAVPGDRVLLSPACASLDMYRNYEERGQVFVDAVRRSLS